MLDRTIPFYNTILRCDHYLTKDTALPNGYSVVTYKPGYEKAWAELEYSVGDFDSDSSTLSLSSQRKVIAGSESTWLGILTPVQGKYLTV